jgi:hypothetical protein
MTSRDRKRKAKCGKTLEPYHEFAGVLFQTAADPHSPLNPFAHAAARLKC